MMVPKPQSIPHSFAPASNSSILTTITEGAIFNTPASFTTVRIVGLLIPRSIRLMYVRSKPASSPSRSCEISLPFRISRNARPNAFSGPIWG
jgi:hypothetical protein